MTNYSRHVERWQNCTKCDLSAYRTQVVLFRGTLPCDVLFIGEAPGESEDVLGAPFKGPAGKLLDRIIGEAEKLSIPFTKAFTNLVGCIPKGEDSKKAGEPPKAAIEACRMRLREAINLGSPSLIVLVGSLSKKWVAKLFPELKTPTVSITHPAAIIRAEAFQQPLAVQEAIVTLSDGVAEALIPF